MTAPDDAGAGAATTPTLASQSTVDSCAARIGAMIELVGTRHPLPPKSSIGSDE